MIRTHYVVHTCLDRINLTSTFLGKHCEQVYTNLGLMVTAPLYIQLIFGYPSLTA